MSKSLYAAIGVGVAVLAGLGIYLWRRANKDEVEIEEVETIDYLTYKLEDGPFDITYNDGDSETCQQNVDELVEMAGRVWRHGLEDD